jgi:anti-sigma-K factor RskA
VDRLVPHEPFTEWVALYALGTLAQEEQTQFEAHLATGCCACATLLADLSAVVTTLAWAAPATSPPLALREKLLTRMHTAPASQEPAAPESVPPVRMPRPSVWAWRHRVLWAGRLAVASLIGVLVWALYDARIQLGTQQVVQRQLMGDLAQERVLTSLVAHTDTWVTSLAAPQSPTPPAAGWIVWSPSKHQGFMVVHSLPALPAGHTYHLWALAGQQAQPAAVFQVDEIGHAALMVSGAVAQPDRFEITVEPAGGVAVPRGPVLLHGRL